MEIDFLLRAGWQERTAAFNEAFAEYIVKVNATAGQLQKRWLRDGVDYEASAGVYFQTDLVAFIATAIAPWQGVQTAYNGGTGVLKAYRGNRLTQKMYDFLLPKFAEKQVKQCLLEVIDQNIPAIKTYEKTGFHIHRDFACFKGVIHIGNASKFAGLQPQIKESDLKNFTVNEADFYDVMPGWQYNFSAARRIADDMKLYSISTENNCVAFALVNRETSQLFQLAVHKSFRNRGYSSALMHHLSQVFPAGISVINVDKSAVALMAFFQNCGLQHFLSQYEMKMLLR